MKKLIILTILLLTGCSLYATEPLAITPRLDGSETMGTASFRYKDGYFMYGIYCSTVNGFRLSDFATVNSTNSKVEQAMFNSSMTFLVPYTVYNASMTEVERLNQTKLNASSGSLVVPYTVFHASTTEIERLINDKLNASSGSLVVPYTVFYTSTTEIERLINLKLSISSGVEIERRIDTKLNASSGTSISDSITALNAVKYSTGSFNIVWVSSDNAAGCVIYPDTICWRSPCDIIVKKIYLGSNVSGSVCVQTSTSTSFAGASPNAFVVVSTGSNLVSGTDYTSNANHWTVTTFNAGTVFKFLIRGTPTTTQNATFSIDYWKRIL